MSIRPLVDEIALIKSRDLLRNVARDLDLMKRWGEKEQEVIGILDDSLELDVVHGTDLIRIRVRHTSPSKAMQIASGFIAAFRERKEEEEKREGRQNLLSAQKAVQDQEELVASKKAEVAEFLKPGSPFFQQLQNNPNAIEQYHHAKNDLEINERLLETMRSDLARADVSLKASTEAVNVHEQPVESRVPVAPNVALWLVAGSGLGLVAGLPLGLVAAWGSSRRGRAAQVASM